MSELFNHSTGEWFYPGFVYKIHNADACDDFGSWEDVAEDDITFCLGLAQSEDYEKIRPAIEAAGATVRCFYKKYDTCKF